MYLILALTCLFCVFSLLTVKQNQLSASEGTVSGWNDLPVDALENVFAFNGENHLFSAELSRKSRIAHRSQFGRSVTAVQNAVERIEFVDNALEYGIDRRVLLRLAIEQDRPEVVAHLVEIAPDSKDTWASIEIEWLMSFDEFCFGAKSVAVLEVLECLKYGHVNTAASDFEIVAWLVRSGIVREEVVRSVIKHESLDLLQLMTPTIVDRRIFWRICEFGAAQSNLELLKWIHYQIKECGGEVFQFASIYDNLDIIRWAQENNIAVDENHSGYLEAARRGDLDYLVWLIEKGVGLSGKLCSEAAANGHMHILKWAILNEITCGSDVYFAAISQKQTVVMGWAFLNGIPFEISENDCKAVATNGDVDSLMFFYSLERRCSPDSLKRAIIENRVNVLDWAYRNGIHVPIDPSEMVSFEFAGNLDVLKWAKLRGIQMNYDRLLFSERQAGNLELRQWLFLEVGDHYMRNRLVQDVCKSFDIHYVDVNNQDLQLIYWAIQVEPEIEITSDVVNFFAKRAGLRTMMFLFETLSVRADARTVNIMARRGRLDLLLLALRHGGQVTDETCQNAIDAINFQILRWLISLKPFGSACKERTVKAGGIIKQWARFHVIN